MAAKLTAEEVLTLNFERWFHSRANKKAFTSLTPEELDKARKAPIDYAAMMPNLEDPKPPVYDPEREKSKNVKSPAAGRGHNNQGRGRGRGESKGRGKGQKGSGRGKGRGKSSNKSTSRRSSLANWANEETLAPHKFAISLDTRALYLSTSSTLPGHALLSSFVCTGLAPE